MKQKPKDSPKHCDFEFKTKSAEQSIAMGRTIGEQLNKGLNLLLYGDLASGKTAFSQGLARGLEVPESYPITSPTYTLINEYPGRVPFFHVDLYRLPEPVDPGELGLDEILEENVVVAIEWADRFHPKDRPSCRLDLYFRTTGENRRSIQINAYGLGATNLLHDTDICRLLENEGIETVRSL